MTEDTASNNPGSTALWTDRAHANEREQEDRLFNDPWATALAEPEGAAFLTASD